MAVGQSDQIDERQNIEHFLEKNHKLITIMSVFGALSIYLLQIRGEFENQLAPNFGSISAIILFLLIAGKLDLRLLKEYKEELNNVLLHQPSRKSLDILLFLIPFNTLILSIVGMGITFENSFALLLQVIALLLGFSSTFWFLSSIEHIQKKIDIRFHPRFHLIFFLLVIPCILTSIVAGISHHLFNELIPFSYVGITVQDPLLAFFSALLLGVLLNGIFYFLLIPYILIKEPDLLF